MSQILLGRKLYVKLLYLGDAYKKHSKIYILYIKQLFKETTNLILTLTIYGTIK